MTGFRYLIPESIYEELIEIAKNIKKNEEGELCIISGWMFADRKENFGIVKGYDITSEDSNAHIRPKSWMRMKKSKIYNMRKLKSDKNIDIIWQFHTHPDGNEELHEVDLKILSYLSTGVMILITPSNILGWYYDKRETKKAIIEKMIFEIISE